MRRLVVALVLANLLVFGWNRGWFDGAGDPSLREENAERLRPVPLSRLEPPVKASAQRGAGAMQSVVPRAAPPAAPAAQTIVPPTVPSSASSSTSSSTSSNAPPSAPANTAPNTQPGTPPVAPTNTPLNAPPGAAPATPAPNPVPTAASASPGVVGPLACRAFPPIDEERAAALRNALEQSGASVDERRTEQGASYLVYLPPSENSAQAQQRLAELRRIGRDDAFVIQDGPMRLAISLGLFRFENAARAMVDQLARAGETRAQIMPRPPIQVRITLQARWPQPEAAAIATMLGAQFDAPARDCD